MQLQGCVRIDQRPAVIDCKQRHGNWEVATIIGKGGTQAIVPLAERKSKLAILAKVGRKTVSQVAYVIIELLPPIKGRGHTITSYFYIWAIAVKINRDFSPLDDRIHK